MEGESHRYLNSWKGENERPRMRANISSTKSKWKLIDGADGQVVVVVFALPAERSAPIQGIHFSKLITFIII